MLKLQNIVVDRSGGAAGTASMVQQALKHIAAGRSVLIFPEGTRTLPVPFPPPAYKLGVVAMYRKLGVPCMPIALNSGLLWPRGTLLRYPGKIVVEILPAIPPGLKSQEFLISLTSRIETSSQLLVDELVAARSSSQQAKSNST